MAGRAEIVVETAVHALSVPITVKTLGRRTTVESKAAGAIARTAADDRIVCCFAFASASEHETAS
jgi:hypothetical protein